jgi:ParB family transcriptional regulator, chromosome partitioning protein
VEAEQEKQRRETAIANTTGVRVLAAITAAVPVRLMNRDLLFLVERLTSLLGENRLTALARQHGVKKDGDTIDKLFVAFIRRADESTSGRILVEGIILLSASRNNASQVLRDAAATYKVDTDAIALKVKQEFAAREKMKNSDKPEPKPTTKSKKAA